MRLIHYSIEPLLKVYSRPHFEGGAGVHKTPGLWVSVDGEYDWLAWCRDNNWGLEHFIYATEIVLTNDAAVKYLSSAADIDQFTMDFYISQGPILKHGLDWSSIRKRWSGIIISPYCWERRLSKHARWYYGWDCASGVIWDASAVKEIRSIDPPNTTESSAGLVASTSNG